MLWLNGKLVAAGQAQIDPADRGFTLGDGVFETLPAISGQPKHIDRHLARLARGAAVLGFAVPYPRDTIVGGIGMVLVSSGAGDSVIRITLTRGPAPRGLLPSETPRPTLMISAGLLPPPAGPAVAIIARSTRRNEMSPVSTIKSLNYLDNILARQEAAEFGAQEAVLLNTKGRVAGATIANVFAVIDGIVVTPPVAEGALPGIRRGLLLEKGRAVEREITEADLQAASEIFLTNSLGLRAVISLEGVAIGDGAPGPVFRSLGG